MQFPLVYLLCLSVVHAGVIPAHVRDSDAAPSTVESRGVDDDQNSDSEGSTYSWTGAVYGDQRKNPQGPPMLNLFAEFHDPWRGKAIESQTLSDPGGILVPQRIDTIVTGIAHSISRGSRASIAGPTKLPDIAYKFAYLDTHSKDELVFDLWGPIGQCPENHKCTVTVSVLDKKWKVTKDGKLWLSSSKQPPPPPAVTKAIVKFEELWIGTSFDQPKMDRDLTADEVPKSVLDLVRPALADVINNNLAPQVGKNQKYKFRRPTDGGQSKDFEIHYTHRYETHANQFATLQVIVWGIPHCLNSAQNTACRLVIRVVDTSDGSRKKGDYSFVKPRD